MSFYKFVAWTNPGLQKNLLKELTALNIKASPYEQRYLPTTAVSFQSQMTDVFSLMHHSHTVTQFYLAMGKTLHARTERELCLQLASVPFHAYLQPNAIVTVKCHCMKSKLMHTTRWAQAITRQIKQHSEQRLLSHQRNQLLDAVDARDTNYLKQVQKRHDEAQQIEVHIYIYKDKAQILFQLHNDSLHKHGMKAQVGKAPLPENVASTFMQYLTNQSGVLWDPFCGSGSLLLSALYGTLHLPIRLSLDVFAPFTNMPIFPRQQYDTYRQASQAKKSLPMKMIGSDFDGVQVKQAIQNLQSLQLELDEVDKIPFLKSTSVLANNVEIVQMEFTKLLNLLARNQFKSKINIISNLPWSQRSPIDNLSKILKLISRSPLIDQAILLVSDKQWKSMNDRDWIVVNEILVGGTWTKMITNKRVTDLQLMHDGHQLALRDNQITTTPLTTQLAVIKAQLSDEQLDYKLFDRAKLAIQPEHRKGEKTTIGRQLSHKKRLEFVDRERAKLRAHVQDTQARVVKQIKEEAIQAHKVLTFDKVLERYQPSSDQLQLIQSKLDRGARLKAEGLIKEVSKVNRRVSSW